MIALPSDVGRGGEGVKGAFRQVLAMMVDTFAGNLGPGTGNPRERALALTAMMVGGMALARAVDDAMLAEELRNSARAQAIAMAGWENYCPNASTLKAMKGSQWFGQTDPREYTSLTREKGCC